MSKVTKKTIEDIADKRKRASAPDINASWRMSSLLQAFNAPAKHREEILRYFPIAVVAAIDGYFRTRMANLIDAGEPFLTNAVSNYSTINIDMEMASALAMKKVSIGELFTYRVSISSFSALIKFVENITGEKGFPRNLATVKPDLFTNLRSEPIISDPDATFEQLSRVFSTRHILCHELASDLRIEEKDTRLLLIAAQDFMKASAIWIESLLAKHFPIRPGERARETKKGITEARKRIRKMMDSAKQSVEIREDLRGAVDAVVTLEKSNTEYLSAVRNTWRILLGPRALPVAEHHSEREELDVLKVFLSTLANMLMEIDLHSARNSGEDFDPLSFLCYVRDESRQY